MPKLKPARPAMAMPPFAPMYSYGREKVTLRTLSLTYETHPEIIEQVLPKPLQPGAEPLVNAWISYFIDPRVEMSDGKWEDMTPYTEGGLMVHCKYKGEPGLYPLIMYITGVNHGFPGREMHAWPKVQCPRVELIEVFDEVMGVVENHQGQAIMTIKAKLTGPSERVLPSWWGPGFNLKLIPRCDGTGYDVNTLVRCELKRSDVRNARKGWGEIVFQESGSQPLHLIEPVKIREVTYGLEELRVVGGPNLEQVESIPTFGVPGWKNLADE